MGHVRGDSLVKQLVGGGVVASRCVAARRRLCVGISRLVTLDPVVGGYRADGDPIVPGENAVADLDYHNGETLARAGVVGPHPLDSHSAVGEERVSPSTLLCSSSQRSDW